jgi:hypothetical protein
MIEIVQAYDGAPIVTLETDDASALESKLSAAARLFADRRCAGAAAASSACSEREASGRGQACIERAAP